MSKRKKKFCFFCFFWFSPRHQNRGHYLIYNLAGVSYDYSKFNGKVLECGWPDHRPPGLEFMNALVLSIHNYLQLDQKNIVAIHCLAGLTFPFLKKNENQETIRIDFKSFLSLDNVHFFFFEI